MLAQYSVHLECMATCKVAWKKTWMPLVLCGTGLEAFMFSSRNWTVGLWCIYWLYIEQLANLQSFLSNGHIVTNQPHTSSKDLISYRQKLQHLWVAQCWSWRFLSEAKACIIKSLFIIHALAWDSSKMPWWSGLYAGPPPGDWGFVLMQALF